MSQIEIDSQHFTGGRQGHEEMTTVLCDVYGTTWPG
jgi:hypothetical protein